MRIFSIPLARKKAITQQLVKDIEKRGEVEIKFKAGAAHITSLEEDGGKEWIAEQVIEAVIDGFEPKQAFKLFSDEFFIERIDLSLAFRRKEKSIERIKARIIGTEGKARKKLEEESGTFIAVSNAKDIVSIIGHFEDLQNAKEAILRLMEGANHESVYRFLAEKNKMKL